MPAYSYTPEHSPSTEALAQHIKDRQAAITGGPDADTTPWLEALADGLWGIGAQGSGSQGPQGTPGAQGNQGNVGAQGNQGNPGVGTQGNQGDAGPQGNQGVNGSSGGPGPQGPQGDVGVGTQGNQGDAGGTGPQGNQGSVGAQGNQGDTGQPGTPGPQGDVGAQGNQGDAGSQGSQGHQGNQGSQGQASTVAGPQGNQGNQGNQGAQGSQGNQGAQGSAGSQGTAGAQGYQGNEGIPGISGPQGNQGNQGYQGNQGNQGYQGNQGTTPDLTNITTKVSATQSSGSVGSTGYFQENSGNDGTGYGLSQIYGGVRGYVYNGYAYHFGVAGYRYADNAGPSAGVLGASSQADNPSVWCALGYKTGAGGTEWAIYGTGSVCLPSVYSDTVGGTNRDLYIDNTGKIGYVSSARRYKEAIEPIPSTEWLDRLEPVSFTLKSDGSRQVGLIAEEVEQVNRDLVGYSKSGEVETVHYSRLIPHLLKAIQELRAEVAALKGAK